MKKIYFLAVFMLCLLTLYVSAFTWICNIEGDLYKQALLWTFRMVCPLAVLISFAWMLENFKKTFK